MQPAPFKLERYFARHEFSAQYLLSASDCESLALSELLGLADERSLALWRELKLGYTESAGHPQLREAVARLYESVTPEQVMIAAPEELIFLAMNTLLRPGDHVITIFPAYQSLYEIARSLGCEVTPWLCQATANGWALDLDELERCRTAKTRLLVVNFPHNPTGYLPTPAELEAIIAWSRRHDLHLFSDEMYRFLEYDPAARLPAVCDRYEKGISLAGLSKSFALAGLRLGWLATREEALLHACLTLKDYTTICNSAPGEILGLMALHARDSIWARNLAIIRANRQHAESFCRVHGDRLRWLAPAAGSVAFPEWRGDGSSDEFCRKLLAAKSVMAVPASIFDFPSNHIRLGLGRKNFAEALQRVDEYLRGN